VYYDEIPFMNLMRTGSGESVPAKYHDAGLGVQRMRDQDLRAPPLAKHCIDNTKLPTTRRIDREM
jgi:hypothetical protein